MHYIGKVIDGIDYGYQVTDAIITPDRAVIDWKEKNALFHFTGKSKDCGFTYTGCFGRPQPKPIYKMELKKFVGKDKSILLFGTWFEQDVGNDGYISFVLETTPTKSSKTGKRRQSSP